MKILAASDIHGHHAVYEWLVHEARTLGVDALILAGDLLGFPDGHDIIEDAHRADAATITSILHDTPAPVYYIMGNDDFVDLDSRHPGIVSLHERRIDFGPWNLVGYQYALPFMGGIYEKPEDEIRADLTALAAQVDSKTILITHSPAHGILDVGVLDQHAGSQAILDLVRDNNVRAHIHGHIHAHFGRVGPHFNVASGGRYRAMLIDLETSKAAW